MRQHARVPRMEASMDQSQIGSRFRRVAPFALAGVGVYAVIAYGSSMLTGPSDHLLVQRATTADQVAAASGAAAGSAPAQAPGPAPAAGAGGQGGTVGPAVRPPATPPR